MAKDIMSLGTVAVPRAGTYQELARCKACGEDITRTHPWRPWHHVRTLTEGCFQEIPDANRDIG